MCAYGKEKARQNNTLVGSACTWMCIVKGYRASRLFVLFLFIPFPVQFSGEKKEHRTRSTPSRRAREKRINGSCIASLRDMSMPFFRAFSLREQRRAEEQYLRFLSFSVLYALQVQKKPSEEQRKRKQTNLMFAKEDKQKRAQRTTKRNENNEEKRKKKNPKRKNGAKYREKQQGNRRTGTLNQNKHLGRIK